MALCTLLSLVTGACLLGSIAAQIGSGDPASGEELCCCYNTYVESTVLTWSTASTITSPKLNCSMITRNAALLFAIDAGVQKCL